MNTVAGDSSDHLGPGGDAGAGPTWHVEFHAGSAGRRAEPHRADPPPSLDPAWPATVAIEPGSGHGPTSVPILAAPWPRLRQLADALLEVNGIDDDRYRESGPVGHSTAGAGSGMIGAALVAGADAVVTVMGETVGHHLSLDVVARWPTWPGRLPDRRRVTRALIEHCHRHAEGSAKDGGRPRPSLELWARPEQPWHQDVAHRMGLESVRALHLLRRPLPIEPAGERTATRDLDPDRDLDAMLAVNNRAFASHPDQGDRDRSYLESAVGRPDFDPADVRIAEDRANGRIMGFCWTKLHRPSAVRPEVGGEIYVVGVDPDYQGRGLGHLLTTAGLTHLHQRGATIGMLYVESDNEPALHLYRKIGFTVDRTDRAWRHV